MMFSVDGWRRVALGAAIGVATLLGSCGGGEQVSRFTATRVIAFGDETSVINADGSKYTVNAVFPGTARLDCASNPLWIQVVANLYTLAFPQCNPNNVNTPTSRIYAVAGAKATDLEGQVSQHEALGGFTPGDLVTMLIGQNDILQAYAQYPAVSEDQLETNLKALGVSVAAQVNRVANTGAKVLIATVPDLGLTPFAITEQSNHGDTNRAELLSNLTLAFNTGLRANIINDGTMIGLVLEDERLQLIEVSPISFGFTNVSDGACAKALPLCTTATMAVDPFSTSGGLANGATWMWADNTHLSPGAQNDFGQLAASRAVNNPF
jgi:phospholipase/lecithinase/hemolysin